MVDKKINVLVFPAGSEVGLEIFNSLKYNLHINIFGLTAKPDHAKYIYESSRYIEQDLYISDPAFIDKFNAVLDQNRIDVIFPTHDSVALYLAEFNMKISAKVLTSPYETAKVAREKKLTFDLFSKFDFCPEIFSFPYKHISYPVFLKPNIGQGGQGTQTAHSKAELEKFLESDESLLVCEYLPGEELTVDCFTNKKGQLLFIGPRVRARTQMGISFNTQSVSLTAEIEQIAETINNTLAFRGSWFLQLKKDQSGSFKLLEFAARQSSTMGLYRQLGVNFALLTVFDALDKEVKIIQNDFSITLDRCLQNRYKLSIDYSRVYIDYDDTLIVNDKVNYIALQYIYQCKNEGISVSLITKHAYNLAESFEKHYIAASIFDEIILLHADDEKYKFISPKHSIFIDNYFFDREKVSTYLNIPVFDVDAIESLIH